MGLFDKIFKFKKNDWFIPDLSKPEYDNWLDFIDKGGTTEEWKFLKAKNNWVFKESKDVYSNKKFKKITSEYFPQMHKIENDWSALYKSKDYTGSMSEIIAEECKKNIELYKQMAELEKRYGSNPPPNAPAFRRLAMIYEKRKEFEKAASVCMDAIKAGAFGNDMYNRLSRMIKKAGRDATEEESILLDDYFKSMKDNKENSSSKSLRSKISASDIDKMQRTEASEEYKKKVYGLYYANYPEKPFISQDRELNTNWIEQAEMFYKQSIIKKSMMKRFSDGLLPGHIYMLYWIENVNRKRIPTYFEYKYGINFEKEKIFLIQNGYLDNDGKITEKGENDIEKHYIVIKNH